MEREKLIKAIADAVEQLLESYFDDIYDDMERAAEEADMTKEFKFGIALKLTLKPSGEKTKFSLDIGWNNPKKYSAGDYVVDSGLQLDMFKKADDEEEKPPAKIALESEDQSIPPLIPKEEASADGMKTEYPDPGFKDSELQKRYKNFMGEEIGPEEEAEDTSNESEESFRPVEYPDKAELEPEPEDMFTEEELEDIEIDPSEDEDETPYFQEDELDDKN